MASKRLETAKKFIEHFASFDRQTLDGILAEDYVHHFAPSLLTSFGPYTKQAFLEHHGQNIESESSNQVVVWATSRAHFRDEIKDDGIREEDWMYEGEYVFILSMDQTGEKMVRGVEFLDSKATLDKLVGLMKRAQENSEKKSRSGGDMISWLEKVPTS